jgi:hypothetical protein
MSRESFFTDVVLSYKKIQSTKAGRFFSLKDYCRIRHVAYRDFIRWASTNEVAASLDGIVPDNKRPSKIKSSSKTSTALTGSKTPLFYPLQIRDSSSDDDTLSPKTSSVCMESNLANREVGEVFSLESSSTLHGIKIKLPCGTDISIREGSGREIAPLVQLCNS